MKTAATLHAFAKLTSVARMAALVASLAIVGLVTRAWAASGEELERADAAQHGGDFEAAIDHYRRALSWDFPGNQRADRALGALLEIGRGARARGETTLALAAYRSAHGAIAAAPRFSSERDASRAEADRAIAAILAERAEGLTDRLDDESARSAPTDRAPTSQRRGTSAGWALLSLVGFATWIGASIRLFSEGFDERGDARGPVIRRLGTLIILGFGAFAVGLALA